MYQRFLMVEPTMINLKARKEGYISKTLLFLLSIRVQDTTHIHNGKCQCRQEQESA